MTWGDVLVLAVLALVIGWVIRGMLRDKKKGKHCGCGSCQGCSGCSLGTQATEDGCGCCGTGK